MLTGRVKRNGRGQLQRLTPVPFVMPISGFYSGDVPLRGPDTPVGPVYKYVDIVHASSIESGCFRIGTLSSFADVEARRADAYEGRHIVESGTRTINGLGGVDRDVDTLQHFGIKTMPGAMMRDVRISGLSAENSCLDMHCICFQGDADAVDEPGKPQAVFRIDDVEELAWRLTAASSKLDNFILGRVRYEERTSNPFAGPVGAPDPFVKPPGAFRWEGETRIMWSRAKWQTPVEPIYVTVKLGKLISRVR